MSSHFLNNLGVAKRILLLLAISGLTILIVALVGWLEMRAGKQKLDTLYLDRAVPLQDLGQIESKLFIVEKQVLLGFQHDPASPLAAIHTHPITLHVENNAAERKAIEALWAKYMEGFLTDEEKALAHDAEQKIKAWLDTTAAYLDQMKAGNFGHGRTAEFLQADRTAGKAAHEALTKLIAYQTSVAKALNEEAGQAYVRSSLILAAVGGIGLILAFGLGTLISRSVTRPLDQAVQAAEAIAQGQLSRPIPAGGQDEPGRLLNAMRTMQAGLRDIVAALQNNAQALDQTARELKDSASRSAEASETQTESAASMAAAIEQMSVSIDHIGESARQAHSVSEQAGEQSRTGGQVVHRAADEIGKIAEAVNASAQTIGELEAVSNEISTIVAVIKEIADQTNLLALNAAIEAARAGEQGRGFAVVADEVRKLAERTGQSTQQIATMIERIQDNTRKAAADMETSVSRVNEGVSLARQAGESITAIQEGSKQVIHAVDDITLALKEQSVASQDIAKSIEHIAQMAEENSATINQTAASARQLDGLAGQLRATVNKFQL